jgi:hypothetical protein
MEVASVAAMLAAGAASKKAPEIPHKVVGPVQNAAIGQGFAAALGGTPVDGVMLAVYTEAIYAAVKSLLNLWKLFRKK